ncbi:MAG TPA: tetratricopeptide repeat protein, partial [Ktedonobacterales bacterium]
MTSAPGRPPTTRRVFISSTALDLEAHRARVRDTLLSLGLFPVGMEQFGARGAGDASSVSAERVGSCDAYLGIVAWRYGHIPAGMTTSVTQQEYEEAGQLGMPRYIFLAAAATDAPDGSDTLFPATTRDAEHRAQLDAFRAELGQSHVVDFFTTPEDLAVRVATALHHYLLRLRDAESAGAIRPPRDLPPRAARFVGRAGELAALCEALRAGQGAGAAAALAGMAGVGKSALAAEALHTLAGDPGAFPGGITFVRCEGRTGPLGLAWVHEQLLSAWGITLAPEELGQATTPEAELELRERALRTRLGGARDGRPPAPALVLLDNVERDLPIGRALDVLAPLRISTLVTARHEPSSPRLRLVTLDVLGPAAAVDLLAERYAGRGGDWSAARDAPAATEVVEALGRLPLAIELAAARAARARTGLAQLAGELRDADRLGKLRDPLDQTRSVRYAFARSLELLSPLRRARFAALGLPEGAEWPRGVIEQVLSAVPGADAATPAGDDLDLLAALSLVVLAAPDAAQSAPRVRLHPLLRELAREEWAAQPEATRHACLAALVASVGELAARAPDDFAALARQEDLIAGAVRGAMRAGVAPAGVAAIVANLDAYLHRGGHWRLGVELSEAQLAACLAVDDRAGAGKARNNLGVLASALGRPDDAAREFEQALAIRQALGDRAGEGETLNNLGTLAGAQGRAAEAERAFQQALAIRRAIGDQQGEGTTLSNLGLVISAEGRQDEAARCFEQALGFFRALGDHAGMGQTLNNLGGLAFAQGRREDAASAFTEALGEMRAAGSRAGEGETLNNLGGLAEAQGRRDEARGYYEQALAIRRELGDRAGEGTTLNNLGGLAYAQGEHDAAARSFTEALAVAREVGDRAGEGTTLSNLGYVATAQGRTAEAVSAFQQALAVQESLGATDAARALRENLARLGAAPAPAPAV